MTLKNHLIILPNDIKQYIIDFIDCKVYDFKKDSLKIFESELIRICCGAKNYCKKSKKYIPDNIYIPLKLKNEKSIIDSILKLPIKNIDENMLLNQTRLVNLNYFIDILYGIKNNISIEKIIEIYYYLKNNVDVINENKTLENKLNILIN